MIKKPVTIRTNMDMASRPIAHLVQEASQYKSSVYIEMENTKINAKSMMGMMSPAPCERDQPDSGRGRGRRRKRSERRGSFSGKQEIIIHRCKTDGGHENSCPSFNIQGGTIMKRMLFIYNPHAGKELIKPKLSDIIDIFVKSGYEVVTYPTQSYRDAYKKVKKFESGAFDLVGVQRRRRHHRRGGDRDDAAERPGSGGVYPHRDYQ